MITKTKAKIFSLTLTLAILLSLPMSIFGEEQPVVVQGPKLTSISFKNATIDGEFNPSISEYTITLEDPNVAPTLKSNTIEGEAKLFITYELDATGKQEGIKATLKHSNISIDYTFKYSNPPKSQITSNNNLGFVECDLCEVYPKINNKTTNYTLFIPSDLNEIKLNVGTQDPNATCKVPGTLKLNNNQELTIKLDVIASNTDVKTYSFKIERTSKTCDEVRALPEDESIAKDIITDEKLEAILITLAVLLGVIALIIFIVITRKLTIKVNDEDEIDFFNIVDENDDLKAE